MMPWAPLVIFTGAFQIVEEIRMISLNPRGDDGQIVPAAGVGSA